MSAFTLSWRLFRPRLLLQWTVSVLRLFWRRSVSTSSAFGEGCHAQDPTSTSKAEGTAVSSVINFAVEYKGTPPKACELLEQDG
mmetsp:Transcript_4529/g.8759  ORF Transcript_4529/g.8759 Transcript_4529/m.8759 type:complete len:84 (+) Transcript_4529:1311-1562(+)